MSLPRRSKHSQCWNWCCFFTLHETVKSKIFIFTFYRITWYISINIVIHVLKFIAMTQYDFKMRYKYLKSISRWDIPNWITFQIYEDSVVNFVCTWKTIVEFSKNGLKSKSGWKKFTYFKPFTACWPTRDWKSLLKTGVAY